MFKIRYLHPASFFRAFLRTLVFCIPFVAWSFSTPLVQAASVYLSPSSGTYKVGQNFSVNVVVSSPDQASNAFSASIAYPRDLLDVTSVSKSGSVMSLWVQEPALSAGTVSFEGIVLNPGYTGGGGKLLTINFKVKAIGTATVNFSSGSVLANDGQGTNILSGLGSARYQLVVSEGGPTPPPPEEVVTGVPSAVPISSPTHPDSNTWYANKNPTFQWTLAKGITGVSVLVDTSPSSNPSTASDGVFASRGYDHIDDGIHYFHLRLKSVAGWGPASHFRFQIDTEKPDRFEIKEQPRQGLMDSKVAFFFDAHDKTSGVDHYEVQIDDGSFQIWRDDGKHIYETPVLGVGSHTLTAKAVDAAGNFLTVSKDFEVSGLLPPTITDYPRVMRSGDILIIKGTTYANMSVTVWLQRDEDEPKSQRAVADQEGKFIFIGNERMKAGLYQVWAEVVNDRGTHSPPSEKLSIAVQPSFWGTIWYWIARIFTFLIPLLLLLLLLLFLLWYLWHRFTDWKRHVRNGMTDATATLHEAFDDLRDDIRRQIKLLEKAKTKRALTDEETRILIRLKQDLDRAERVIKKKLDQVERELNRR